MGTPDFSVPALEAIFGAGHDVVAVYSQPPRPAGRGKKLQPSPVHLAAERHGIEVRTPKSLKSDDVQAAFSDLNLDVAVVVAYGLILPKAILDAPRLGCVNIHASLLPRWRGAAPIQRALMAGDTETGVTIMKMDEGLDTGGMLMVEALEIDGMETAGGLHDRLSALGAEMIGPALEAYASGDLTETPQPEEGVTYASKIDKSEARIAWDRTATKIKNHIHGISPFPGAWFEHDGQRIKVLACQVLDLGALTNDPGTVLDDELTISTADGAVRLIKVQRQGKGPMDAADFLRGFDLPLGTVLD